MSWRQTLAWQVESKGYLLKIQGVGERWDVSDDSGVENVAEEYDGMNLEGESSHRTWMELFWFPSAEHAMTFLGRIRSDLRETARGVKIEGWKVAEDARKIGLPADFTPTSQKVDLISLV